MRDLWREHRALLGRWWARLRREPVVIVGTLVQPVVWLLLFGNLLAKLAAGDVPGGDYIRFITAGTVVMTIFNAAMVGGVELLFDRETGLLVRLFASPVRRLSIVTSRFIFVVGMGCVQALVIMLAAMAIGVRYAGGLGAIALSLLAGALFGAGITSLSIVLAFSLKSHASFFPIVGFVGLPLTFASSALVPVALMPEWMRAIAMVNPMTYAVDAVRSLTVEGWSLGVLGPAMAALVVFDLACLALATLVLRRGLA